MIHYSKFLAVGLLVFLSVSASSAAEFHGTFRFGPVPSTQIEIVAAKEPVVVRMNVGEKVTILSRSIEASSASIVMMGISADFVFFAVVSGGIMAEESKLMPGEVAFWSSLGAVETATFDAGRLINTLELSDNSDVVIALEELQQRQERLIYWGVLSNNGGNLQASTPAGIEIARRSYLSHPAVMQLRFNPTDGDLFAQEIADTFVRGVAKADIDLVAAFLHPSYFVESADNGVSPSALARRYDFASDLVRVHVTQMGDGETVALVSDGVWYAGRELKFTLESSDGFLFVVPSSLN